MEVQWRCSGGAAEQRAGLAGSSWQPDSARAMNEPIKRERMRNPNSALRSRERYERRERKKKTLSHVVIDQLDFILRGKDLKRSQLLYLKSRHTSNLVPARCPFWVGEGIVYIVIYPVSRRLTEAECVFEITSLGKHTWRTTSAVV